MRIKFKSDEKQIRIELVLFITGLILSIGLIGLGALQDQSNIWCGILIGIGASILASEIIFIIQKILMTTPQQAVNEFKIDLNRAFHGLIISDLEYIYEECLFWIKYSLEKGFDIYELSTSPNCEYFEDELRKILTEHSKKNSKHKKSYYYRYFDKSIDKSQKNSSSIPHIDERYCIEESLDNVTNGLGVLAEEPWLKIISDKKIPTDAILIVNKGNPIYTMVELYDYCLDNGDRSVLSFSSNHPEFLFQIHTQIRAIH